MIIIITYNVVTGLMQATVTDSEGLTGTETMTVVVGEPFSLEMSPESGKWVVGDTIQVRDNAHETVVSLSLLGIEQCIGGVVSTVPICLINSEACRYG